MAPSLAAAYNIYGIDVEGGLLDFRTPPCQAIANVKIPIACAHGDYDAWKGLRVAEQVVILITSSPGFD